ncbi:MAG TPA: hypothetical protein VFF78_00850, partial [Anaerolineaceae bacterium]|nr:hypothetical protein [Anaerolineaceae bacterium]
GRQWDLASADLIDYARERGWCKGSADFDFAGCYSEPIYTRAGAGISRQACTTGLLQNEHGKLTLPTIFGLLRTHADATPLRKRESLRLTGKDIQVNSSPMKDTGEWTPDRAIFGAQVCMHTGWGPVRESQSVGSMVARLDDSWDEIWATGTSAPCTGIFKPVWMDVDLPDLGPSPRGTYDGKSLWWRHEMLHREVLRDYPRRMKVYSAQRDALESQFLAGAQAVRGLSKQERLDFSTACFEKAGQASAEWLKMVQMTVPQRTLRLYYRLAWKKINRRAQLEPVAIAKEG